MASSGGAEPQSAARRRGLAALAAGLLILALGATAALWRNGNDSGDDRLAGQADVARRAAARAPRFDVSLLQFLLRDLDVLTGRAPSSDGLNADLVPTAVVERLRTGRPPVHPDFGSMWYRRENPDYVAAFTRAFREGLVRDAKIWVVGLLVTQVTPGRARLSLDVDRFELRGFREAIDPSDGLKRPAGRSLRARRVETIAWSQMARPNAAALVPLFLIHSFLIPPTRANDALLRAAGDQRLWRVTDHVVLAPRRLVARAAGGEASGIALDDALDTPLLLEHVGRE